MGRPCPGYATPLHRRPPAPGPAGSACVASGYPPRTRRRRHRRSRSAAGAPPPSAAGGGAPRPWWPPQRGIAGQAAAEGAGGAGKVQPVDDLAELPFRLDGADITAVGQVTSLEELPVPGEHDAAFAKGERHQCRVVDVVGVEGVEAGHAQEARQAAQMGVGGEAGLPRGPLAHAQQRCHVHRLELRVYRHPVAVGQHPVEAAGCAVHQDQFHLGVGDAQGLDHVLHRRVPGAGHRDVPHAPMPRQEVVQFLVEAEGRLHHGGMSLPNPAGCSFCSGMPPRR